MNPTFQQKSDSVASHSSTEGNSIEQLKSKIKELEKRLEEMIEIAAEESTIREGLEQQLKILKQANND